MEAFEKQLKEWYKKGLPLSPGDCLHNTQAGLQVGWRAALNHILAMKINSAHCKTELDVLRDWIEQELEQK